MLFTFFAFCQKNHKIPRKTIIFVFNWVFLKKKMSKNQKISSKMIFIGMGVRSYERPSGLGNLQKRHYKRRKNHAFLLKIRRLGARLK